VDRRLPHKAYENEMHQAWLPATSSCPSSFDLDEVALRWSLPPDAYSDDGMGGGITFAFHRDLCGRLEPLFPEANHALSDWFLSCDDLRNTIKRAMDTWAINHKHLSFKDVTEECRDVVGVDSCPAAELFIVPEDAETSSAGDLAAWVVHELAEGDVDRQPWTTAGQRLDGPHGRFGLPAPQVPAAATSPPPPHVHASHPAMCMHLTPPCACISRRHVHASQVPSAGTSMPPSVTASTGGRRPTWM
jgi:hypothetical protein